MRNGLEIDRTYIDEAQDYEPSCELLDNLKVDLKPGVLGQMIGEKIKLNTTREQISDTDAYFSKK